MARMPLCLGADVERLLSMQARSHLRAALDFAVSVYSLCIVALNCYITSVGGGTGALVPMSGEVGMCSSGLLPAGIPVALLQRSTKCSSSVLT